jgi:hypothetical protein
LAKKMVLVELDEDAALGIDALAQLEAQRPLDQRLVLAKEQIVGFRPVHPADLVDVAEPLRDEERRARAGALQHGIDRDRGAVQEEPRLRKR